MDIIKEAGKDKLDDSWNDLTYRDRPDQVFAMLESGLVSSEDNQQLDLVPARRSRRLDHILLLYFVVILIAGLGLAGCADKTEGMLDEARLVALTETGLPSVKATETEASEQSASNRNEAEQASVSESSLAYDAERPEIFLADYFRRYNLDLTLLEDRDFLAAIKGMNQADAIYFSRAMLSVSDLDLEAAEDESNGVSQPSPEGQVLAVELNSPAAGPGQLPAAEPEPSQAVLETPAGQAEQTQASSQVAQTEPLPVETTVQSQIDQTQAAGSSSDQIAASGVFDLTNSSRAALGLGQLAYDPQLAQIAQVRVNELAISFSHTRPDGTNASRMGINAGYSHSGENIAYYSWQASGEEIFNGFKNSHSHWQNMINPGYTRMAVVSATINGALYTVMYFAAP